MADQMFYTPPRRVVVENEVDSETTLSITFAGAGNGLGVEAVETAVADLKRRLMAALDG